MAKYGQLQYIDNFSAIFFCSPDIYQKGDWLGKKTLSGSGPETIRLL